MKKNEIRFVATEQGINCEGNMVLSEEAKKKVEDNMQKVENAAKDCGVSLSLSPVGIQLGFNVALSCDVKCINEADARMKCIVEEMREFIGKLEPKKHEEKPEDEVIAEEQHKAIDKFFDEMHEKYPKAKLTIVCDDNNWVGVASNMHPMHVLQCMIGAIEAEKHGENQ